MLLQATIGIDFLSKTMYLEDRTVRLQLWCGWAGRGGAGRPAAAAAVGGKLLDSALLA